MVPNNKLRKYSKKLEYSYTYGMFPTFELLKKNSSNVIKVLMHSTISDDIRKKIISLCEDKKIEYYVNDKLVEKLREKESCLLIGVFYKYNLVLDSDKDHIVLVNPSDSGNVGTILRTALGFGIHDICIIEPAVDVFNPKTVRASMGAIFSLNIQKFQSFEYYLDMYGSDRKMYPFMLKATKKLGELEIDGGKFSLIFGNEATGLDDRFLEVGQSVIISHSSEIDSLNLSLASGIAIYEFTKKKYNK